ncbi:Bcr/CflA family efflux MFS transporter [Helicobacter jaachi]|uniref:Bcr/CflA family efflux MFS transporter n=1 Tax=Helicobacter jaachi TaxID=1677920 RepID=A0A4U8T8R8_9HELI|nr:multidrug effflux MFS transporter [Helicobacter jaachi]TLD95117.1 Bcr/CflA family efflux MFS transporter [Helicobacter jaachi]
MPSNTPNKRTQNPHNTESSAPLTPAPDVKVLDSKASKAFLIFLLAFMSSIAPLSTDMYLPALPNVSKSFAVSDFYTQLSLASFFIAFAFGQLIYGPLSDVFGRKKPLCVGLVLFIGASVGCVLVDSIYVFIALRFLEALGGCAGIVIARAIVNDKFPLKEAASVFALMMVVSSLAPMLAPSLGSMLLRFFEWHSIFLSLFLMGIVLFVLILVGFRESAPAHSAPFSQKETLANYKLILCDKVFMGFVLAGAFAMSAMFAYITGSSFLFMQVFLLDTTTYSIVFAINALGLMLCSMINAKIVFTYSPLVVLKWAFVAMSCFVVLLLGAGFLGHFLIFEIALFATLSSLGFLLPNLTTLAMARFKAHSGTASAVLGTTQFALAGIISFLVGALEANTPFMLACLMAIVVWLGSALFFSTQTRQKGNM